MSSDPLLKEMVEVRLSLKRELFEDLRTQLLHLRGSDVPGLHEVKTVEELIVFYLKQLSSFTEKLTEVKNDMDDFFEKLNLDHEDLSEAIKEATEQSRKRKEERIKRKN